MATKSLSTTVFARICRHVASGKSLRKALKAPGMPSMGKFFDAIDKEPDWAEQYARARQRGLELHIDGLIDLADSATAENAHAVRLQVDVRKWIASKILPRIYGDRQQIEVSAPGFDLGERLRRAQQEDRLRRAEARVVSTQTPEVVVEALPAPAGRLRVRSDAEYNALPRGVVFIDPEGQERQKP